MTANEAWKDELLQRPFINYLDLLIMSQDKHEWVMDNPHLFEPHDNGYGMRNLLLTEKDNGSAS